MLELLFLYRYNEIMIALLPVLLHALGISFGINILLFIIAYVWQTDRFTDFSYSLSFVAIALYGFLLSDQTPWHTVFLLLVITWALRLGGYLVYRIHTMGRDTRFDSFRHDFKGFISFWIVQAVAAWLILFPVLYVFSLSSTAIASFLSSSTSLVASGYTITLLGVIGCIVWLYGLLVETIADLQKFWHKNANKSPAWVDAGLWRYSRHPNYFGEMLCWWGVFLIAAQFSQGINVIFLIIGPLTISIILLFFSGVPPLEKRYDAMYGASRDYQEYKKRTSSVIVLPHQLTRWLRQIFGANRLV